MGKGIEVQFDKKRVLRFDINAFADLEEHAGRGLASLFDEANVGINTIRLIVWAGLKHEIPDLSIKKAGILVQCCLDNGKSLAELTEAIKKAIAASGLVKVESENPTGEVPVSEPLPTG